MKTISSRQNPWFKRVRDAMRSHGEEIAVEGPKQVHDALAAGWKPLALITRGGGELAVDERHDRTEPYELAFTAEIFDQLAETKSPQNAIALFHRPVGSAPEILRHTDRIVVALDGVQDPGNVGTIVRLAAAFDCAGVVLLAGCADPFSPKSIRASAGAILSVPVSAATPQDLFASGLDVFYADAAGAAVAPPSRGAVLVFGNEGTGVSADVRRGATAIAIPMSVRVESLNVAASAAILLARSFEGRS